jgi:hypothetical protein
MHHDCTTTQGDKAGVGGTKAPARSGDDDDLIVEADRTHLLDFLYAGMSFSAAATVFGSVTIA